jgi:prophage regulatory protein
MRRAPTIVPAAAAAPESPRAAPRCLRLPELMVRTGLKKTAIYAAIRRGQLPAPKKLGGASIWPEETVQAALDALPTGCP